MVTQKVQKVPKLFQCICCDYTSIRNSQYERHILTAKHLKMANDNKNVQESSNKYECECGNIYKNRHNLSRHKKACKNNNTESITGSYNIVNSTTVKEPSNHDLILNLLKQNNDLQKQIIELSKEPKVINYVTNSGNTNNSQFNLNIFLNETCKNAINFSEFIDNIKVSYDDLENNAKMGFVDGMTKIIMDNLKQLELNDRPIHCTDVKRETIYVKEEDQWEKDKSKDVLQKGIQEITRKNMCQLTEWREENPEYDDMETEMGEKSIILQQNLMAGCKRDEFYPKIINNIAKETVLDKKKDDRINA